MKEKKVLGEKMELNSINCASAEFFKVLWGTEPPYGKSTFIKKKNGLSLKCTPGEIFCQLHRTNTESSCVFQKKLEEGHHLMN